MAMLASGMKVIGDCGLDLNFMLRDGQKRFTFWDECVFCSRSYVDYNNKVNYFLALFPYHVVLRIEQIRLS